MPTRILVVSFDFSPMRGGIATCAENVSRVLAKDTSTQVRVVTARRPGLHRKELPFELVPVPFARHPWAAAVLFSVVIAWQILFWRPTAVLSLLWSPDGLACALATLGGRLAPYFVFAHGVEVMESRRNAWKRIRSALAPLKAWVFRQSAGVFSVSRFTGDLVHERCRVRRDRIHVVANGVDCTAFLPATRSSSVSDCCTFLSVCRLDDYKGVDQAILAVDRLRARYPGIRYQVAGTGADLGRLRRLVEERRLLEHVQFVGAVTPAELLRLYQEADCFLLPCREDRLAPNVEGFGIVFLEASACGLPIIAGASGGVPDAVADGDSGWLVDPLDVDQISERMRAMIESPSLRREIGLRGRQRAEQNFTWDIACGKIRRELSAHVRN